MRALIGGNLAKKQYCNQNFKVLNLFWSKEG